MSSQKKRLKRRLKQEDEEQEKQHELFTKTSHQQKMFYGFGFGVLVSDYLYPVWFQYDCKLNMIDPEEIGDFISVLIGMLLGGIFSWIMIYDFERKEGLANSSFFAGLLTCCFTYLFSQNVQLATTIISTILFTCLTGAILSFLYHRLKATVSSLPN